MSIAAAPALIGTALPGCSTCVVTLRDGNAGNEIHSAGVVFGNRYIVAQPDPGQATSTGLHQVVIEDNLLYDVIGVATLGLLKPCKITYRNIKPPIDDGGDMTRAMVLE